jgi:DNA polymerase-3 subunit alpha
MYYNLHSHTHYSNTRLLDAINKEGDLIDTAHELGLGGIAITDHEILSAHVKAQKHLAKRKKENPDDESWQKFKLILGNEIYLCRNGLSESNFIKGEDYFYHFILLALDAEGHRQIRELSTRAFKRSWFRNMRRVPTYYSDIEEVIGANPGHVWGSTACIGGYFGRQVLAETMEAAENIDKFIQWGKKTFDGFFSLELQPSNEKDQKKVNQVAFMKATRMEVPYIITTDAHYLRPEDRKIHKAFLNSKGGERETDAFYATTYVMTEEEIHELMDGTLGRDGAALYVDNALKKTCDIAQLVQEYSLIKETRLPYMPLELLPRPTDFFSNDMKNLNIFFNSEEEADRQLAYKIINFIRANPIYSHFRQKNESEVGKVFTSGC